MNKIAILMATYNGGQFIKEQIDSIFAQTNKDWNLYIRDDGSSDLTIEIINGYCQKYSNITLLKDSLGSLGCRDQFLHLMNVVDADYYMFCDQDDMWVPDKIEKSLNLIKRVEAQNPGKAVLVGSDCYMCGPNLEVINPSCWDHLRINPREFLTKNGIYVYPFVTGASMIFNRKACKTIPPIPEGCPKNRPMYDWWLLIHVFKTGVVDLLEEPTRYYRQHTNNVSGGIDKLDTSYFSKIMQLGKVIQSNRTRASILKKIGYGSIFKYYFFKIVYLTKMMKYNHKTQK